MGHNAFRAHVKDIQNTADEDERRKLIRHRFRESLLEATPYCLRLRQDGCNTVLDLVKYNLPDLILPPALQARHSLSITLNPNSTQLLALALPAYLTLNYLNSYPNPILDDVMTGPSGVLTLRGCRARYHRQDLPHQERHPADGQGAVFGPAHVRPSVPAVTLRRAGEIHATRWATRNTNTLYY